MADIKTLLENMDSPVKASEIVTTGAHPLKMNDTVWDDLTIPAQSQDLANPNPPVWRLRVDGGNTSTARFLLFSNSTFEDTYATVPKTVANSLSYAANSKWTLSLWIKPEAKESGIIELSSNISLSIDGASNLVMQWGSETEVTLLSGITYGQWYHVLVRSKDISTSKTTVQAFVNNVRKFRKTYSSVLLESGSSVFVLGALGDGTLVSYNGDVGIEELIIYNSYVTNGQKNELWNSGDGRTTVVTGTTVLADVALWFHFDQTTGTTIDDSATMADTPNDGTITGAHYSWPEGGVGSGNNALGGLKSLFFSAGDNQQSEFSEQVLHKFANGTGFEARLHMHIQLDGIWDGVATLPVFGIEYSFNNVFEVEGNTLTVFSDAVYMNHDGVTTPTTGKRQHGLVLFTIPVTETNAGNPVNPSCMISGRLFRKDDDGSTFGVFQLQSDYHIPQDKPGTAFEWHD